VSGPGGRLRARPGHFRYVHLAYITTDSYTLNGQRADVKWRREIGSRKTKSPCRGSVSFVGGIHSSKRPIHELPTIDPHPPKARREYTRGIWSVLETAIPPAV
jgi:hypothetical protein